MAEKNAVKIEVKIPGVLRGKQRPRFTRAGHVYTPQETLNMEAWIRHCVLEQSKNVFIDQPVRISVKVVVGIPKSWSSKKRALAFLGELLPTSKPDFDNVMKVIADALNGVIWKDDAQVVVSYFEKVYGEVPETLLEITSL